MSTREGLEEEVCEEEFSLDTVFRLPASLTEHYISGKYLIISPETANWLVFADEVECAAFRLLNQGKSIREVVDSSPEITEEKVASVVSQIAAKDFMSDAKVCTKENLKTATVHLTRGCNLRCRTCYLKAVVVVSKDESTTEDLKHFLSRFKELGGEIITITGGEPMIRKDFFDILSYAKELGLQIVLLTNGTLIDEEGARKISLTCDEVQVSIDGPNRETNDKIRGKGSFDKAVSALKLLKKRKCRIAIAMTPTPETLPAFREGLSAFAKWSKKNIGRNIIFRVTSTLLEGRDICCLSVSEQDSFHREVVDICNDQLEDGWFDILDAATIIPNRRITGCGMGESFMVSHDGTIKTCIFSSDSVGGIKDDLCAVSKKLKDLSNSLRVENTKPCRDCDLRYFCGGKCRLENVKENGGLNILSCSEAFRAEWYERLVRINPYIFEQVLD